MRLVRNELRRFWSQIAGRPLIAKLAACIIVVGILGLLTSPEVMDRGRAAASLLAKPYLPPETSQTKDMACTGNHSSQLTLNPQP